MVSDAHVLDSSGKTPDSQDVLVDGAPESMSDVGGGAQQVTESLTTQQKTAMGRMERYCEQMARTRTHTTAAKYAGISYATAMRWKATDYLGFAERVANAEISFCDMLEDFAIGTALKLKPGQTPILLLALLNANLSDKYRQATAMSEDTARQLLSKYKRGMSKPTEPIEDTEAAD
jgi:hypothetical protein